MEKNKIIRRSILFAFIFALLTGCSPVQPASAPETVAAEQPAPAETVSEMAVEVPVQEAAPVTWEYKTLIARARIGGPVGEKLEGGECPELTDHVGGGSICLGEDLNTPLLERLNTLGADRWELVSVVYSPENDSAVYFFKRPISPP